MKTLKLTAALAMICALSLSLRGADFLPGVVTAWGRNESHQREAPADLTNVVAIAAGFRHSVALRADGTGSYHSLALKTDGHVVCWGRNSEGQCDPPASATNLVAIAAGGNHSLALRRGGTIVA